MQKFLRQLKRSSFYIKLMNWEYWPIYIVNIPVIFFWLYYALRARSLFFFSAANPAIETGGVLGESKINILRRIPQRAIPITVFIPSGTPYETAHEQMTSAGLDFPIIAKPNVGERGFLVAKLQTADELKAYVEAHQLDFLLQEFVAWPEEVSIMYHRFPEADKGQITSVCVKEMLKVCGDGRSSVRELMAAKDRARLQVERFTSENHPLLSKVPAVGEWVELEPIGNHSRGTMFLNGNHHIDEALRAVIDQMGQGMEDIFYGRFDMKCESIEALKQGRHFKVLEFNGIASEPAHIYDPSYPIWKKYRDIFQHWGIIYRISQVQRQRGVYGMSWKEAFVSVRNYFGYMKTAG
ncbi:MAG: hypothetical protein AAFV95_19675 [Bacteroidota bacterium]